MTGDQRGFTEAEGYAASLRQQAQWIEDAGQAVDFDADELRAAADFIERTFAENRIIPKGHVALPQSREEAEMMNLISERHLFPERFKSSAA